MRIIFIIIGAFIGLKVGQYIVSDFPILSALLGNDGVSGYGRYSMPSGMLPFGMLVLGGVAGSLSYDSFFKKK